MIKDQQAEYKELLEELRHRYRQKYNVTLDDEILYLVIRVNELQVDIKKEIKAIPRVTFPKGIDYFWYGLGRTAGFLIFGVGLIVVGALLFNTVYKRRVLILDEEVIKVEQKQVKADTVIKKYLKYKK